MSVPSEEELRADARAQARDLARAYRAYLKAERQGEPIMEFEGSPIADLCEIVEDACANAGISAEMIPNMAFVRGQLEGILLDWICEESNS